MKKLFVAFFSVSLLFSCGGDGGDGNGSPSDSTIVEVESMGFSTLSSEETGIDFYNTITESDDYNFYTYEYIYNGGGVAVGDINNDGLTDVYFTGNQVQDKLYLNKGDMKFEDISATAFDENANLGWHTGVNMVDINADGWLDIYVCRSGDPEDKALLENLLFINNKDNTFSEKSVEYGVNVRARSTHSAFFDYDKDGDLDLYVLNHPTKRAGDKFVTVAEFKRLKKYGLDADVFLENQDGKFVDISKKAGIENNCFGLGIAVSDLDGNGYPDVYISNDYQDPDFMYMNNGDGTFSEEIKERTNHIPNYSMGNDMADFNNDGAIDIMTVDMAAEDHVRSKRNMGGMSTQNFWDLVFVGFHYQFMFNGLQMNNGNGTFSEVAQVAGVSKTDWSWAPLFADFDNDGKKDLFVTNGYKREARDNDYSRTHAKLEKDGEIENFEEGLALMPTTKIFNYIYQNKGDIHFEKKTKDWNFDAPVNSNGAAFADFDNDGDLDLVVNNMEETSFIMENTLQSKNNYIRFKLEGEGGNTSSIGAKIKITTGDEIQYQELNVARGYESSVEGIVHFGLGGYGKVDLVEVVWPNGKIVSKTNLDANQVYAFKNADGVAGEMASKKVSPLMDDVSDSLFTFLHQERMVNDFESEVLLPNKMSQLGPFISKGDANGDGLEDMYISGASDIAGKLFIQKAGGTGFVEKKGPWDKEKEREEMDSEFLDVDGDGDLDLYVVSGGNEFSYNSSTNYDQLYINDGKGNYKNESATRLPKLETSGQRIAVGDYDSDGDLDIYVAGRQTPGYYPFAPRSFLLNNDGQGKFKDVTRESIGANQVKEDLSIMGPGMVTDVIFDDFDQDQDLDLIMVGEWMPICFFENVDGQFTNVNAKQNPDGDIGWWYSISKGDFNGDGKNDYIVGNLGENNKFHPSKDKPLEIYCHDFDESGTYDIVLAKYQENICYPVRGRQCTSEQMPFIQEKFPTYSEFATADIESIYGEEVLSKALHYSATSFASVSLMSSDVGYKKQNLPVYAQLGPINETIILDLNGDGYLDVISVGNNFAAEVETIRYDGGRGVVLLGSKSGEFTQLTPNQSGFFENQDCKDMEILNVNGKKIIITVSNRGKSKSFMIKG